MGNQSVSVAFLSQTHEGPRAAKSKADLSWRSRGRNKPMGERSRGKDKGKTKKSPKAVKVGRRPHELQQQLRDALKRPSGGSA